MKGLKHWDNERGVERARVFGNHILGANAEQMVGLETGGTWTASTTLENDKPDIFHNILGAIEVRSSPTRRTLHVYDKDHERWPHVPFVAVYWRDDWCCEILGWLEKPSDGFLEMWQKPYGKKDRHFEVPEKHLKPWTEFMARLKPEVQEEKLW